MPVPALAADGLKGRNFDNGQKMFAATRCIICYRFAGDGGATGPDLTQLAGRCNLKDLTADLLKPLNRDEMLDLLAYVLSRGDKGSEMFSN